MKDGFKFSLDSLLLAEFVNIKKDDIFCRIGGEEFVLITDSLATKDDLVKFSNKLRTSVEDFDFDLGYKVTISVGATFFKENDTKDTIFKRADEALYISKNSGRNRFCCD